MRSTTLLSPGLSSGMGQLCRRQQSTHLEELSFIFSALLEHTRCCAFFCVPVGACALAYTSHRCIHMSTYSCTCKLMYLYVCIVDMHTKYVCTYLHFRVACVKIQITTFTSNAFHSTLSAKWHERKTHFPPSQYTQEKTTFPSVVTLLFTSVAL